MAKIPSKPKKKTPSQLKKILWEHCKRITRARYADGNGNWHCYTCGRLIDDPSKAHTGHFIPSSTCGAFLRYDLRNLRVQCYACNINGGGQGALFYKNLVRDNGQEYVDTLFRDKEKTVKATDHVILLIGEYEKL